MTSIDQSLSLYIPRVTRRMTAKFITNTIEAMRIGLVDKVDMAETADGRQMTAYIHFSKWEETPANIQLQQRIKDPKQQARLVYDAPWYWILLVNNNPEPAEAMDVVEEKVVTPSTTVDPISRTVNAHNTFAAVLCRTTVRTPLSVDTTHPQIDPFPPMVAPRNSAALKQPSNQDIDEMTQMAMECDEEWNNTLREQAVVRDQGVDTEESYTQRLNEELKVIICDLQTRLVWCEQMCVNTDFRVETSNDAIVSLTARNYHVTNHINTVDARLADVENEMWPNESAEVSDGEE